LNHEFSFEDEAKFYVRQNEEASEPEMAEDSSESSEPQEKTISETEMNKILAAREKRLKQQFNRQTKDMVTKDSLQEMLSGLSNTSDQPSGGETEATSESEPATEDKGIKSQLTQLQTQLNRINEENERLQKLSEQREHDMKMERRKHNVEGQLSKIGAVKPSQAYRIIEERIIDDPEIGDAVKVKTPHGEDYIPVEEFLGQFKEDNMHLFSQPSRSGSGAGSGGSGAEKPRFTADHIRDHTKGGMSWSDYEKNRDKILKDIESRRGK